MKIYNHLSYEDRKNIEDGLNENKFINQIAKELNRSHSSILRKTDRNKVYFKPKKIIIIIGIYRVKDYLKRLMFDLEVVVEKKDILIIQDKSMIHIKK